MDAAPEVFENVGRGRSAPLADQCSLLSPPRVDTGFIDLKQIFTCVYTSSYTLHGVFESCRRLQSSWARRRKSLRLRSGSMGFAGPTQDANAEAVYDGV